MESLRELAISIGWKINNTVLRRADQLTDRYRDNVQGAERDIENLGAAVSELGGDFRRSGTQAERSLEGVENAADDVQKAIRGIPDPEVDSSRAEREIMQIEVSAEDLAQTIRSIPDPKIDGSQANKELKSLKEEASQLQNILGAITGGATGAVIGTDITTFAQMPREFQAQLGVTEDIAKNMANVTEQLWTDIPGITREGAYEAVAMANQFFDAVGNRAYDLGREMLFLHQQTGTEMTQLARAANLMESRFDDIESPQEAFDLLAVASQRLPRDMFDELIEQTSEYGGNIAAVGITANDFLSAMIQGGERSQWAMDRFGDILSNEFIPRIRTADETALEALATLAGSEKQAEEWREAILQGGKEGRESILEIIQAIGAVDEAQRSVIGSSLFGAMYEEQENEILPILENLGKGFDDLGGDIEELAVRGEGPLNDVRRWLRNIRSELDEMTGGAFGEFAEVAGAALPGVLGFAGASWASKLFRRGGASGKSAGSLNRITSSIGKIGGGIGKLAGRAFIPLSVGLGAYNILTSQKGDRGGAIGSLAGGLGGAAAGAAIGSIIPGVGTLMGGAIGGLAGSFGGEEIGQWIQDIDFSAIPEKAKNAKDKAIEWIKQLPDDVAEQLGYMAGRAVGELQQLPGEFSAWFEKSYNNAIEWVSGLPDAVGGFLASIPERVIGSIGNMWSAFVEWGRSIPGAIMEGFNSAVEGLGDAGKWILDQIGKGISGLKNLGGRVAEGFERGRVAAHAIGGIFDRPHIGLFAEDGAEAIIPLEKHRNRALSLWMETGRILGVQPYAEGGITGSVSIANTGVARSALSSLNFNPTVQINVYGGNSEQAANIKQEIERVFPDLMEDFFERLALKMG